MLELIISGETASAGRAGAAGDSVCASGGRFRCRRRCAVDSAASPCRRATETNVYSAEEEHALVRLVNPSGGRVLEQYELGWDGAGSGEEKDEALRIRREDIGDLDYV